MGADKYLRDLVYAKWNGIVGAQGATGPGGPTGPASTTTYQNQIVKTGAKLWSGVTITTSGVATFFPTSDNTGTGTALFTNIFAVHVSAANNTGTAVAVPTASVKLIAANKKSVTANAIIGVTLSVVGDTVTFAPDGTNVYMTIIGN